MNKSRVGLWIDIMYKIHTLTKASKDSLETISSLVSHIEEGRPIMAVQDDEELSNVVQAIKYLSEEGEVETTH